MIGAKTTCETRKYFDHFSDDRSLFGKKNRHDLLALAKQWEGEGLIQSEDRKKIEAKFNNTALKSLNVIPGFTVSRQWDLDTVIELETEGKLEEHIIEELSTILAIWKEDL